jgi:predicted DNA-binding transcriptional regulator AlpA
MPADPARVQETLSTARQVVRVRTARGTLTIGPYGRLKGLWRIVQRETLTAQEVRKLCGWKDRHSLLYWRQRDFPPPVLTYQAWGRPLELWSRSDVEEWIEDRG